MCSSLGPTLGFWTSWKSVSFAILGKFSFIICPNKFSISCSSSSPSGTPMIWMLEQLKLTQRFLSFSSFFCILVSSFCSSWMFTYSFCSKPLIWVPVSFPSLLVPCILCFISLCVAFISSLILWPSSIILWNQSIILITRALNCISERLSISSSLSYFSGVLLFSFIGPYFFVLAYLLCCKRQSLRYLPGQGNPPCCIVVLSVGEGPERE